MRSLQSKAYGLSIPEVSFISRVKLAMSIVWAYVTLLFKHMRILISLSI